MPPSVRLTARGLERLHSGHPWIYRTDLADIDATGGDVVAVRDPRGRPLASAFYSDQSQIALRLLAHAPVPDAEALIDERIGRAIEFRDSLALDATAFRLVHGEGDLLPGLVVDRYGDVLVVQALTQAIERRLPFIAEVLMRRCAPGGILARNDPRVRALEGLGQEVKVLAGEVPQTVSAREGPVEYEVDVWRGQKTGLFLDQRENREAAAAYAHGRLLDAFSYNGGFALRLAGRVANALAIDVSEEAGARIRANAGRNGATNVEVRVANVFDELREYDRAGERFDTIVLDPPAFAKSRHAVPRARAGYKEINLRALKLLPVGGILVTCTCSYHVSEADFGAIVYEAATDAGAMVTVLEKRMQGRDHPVLLAAPETYYLKCFILRRVG